MNKKIVDRALLAALILIMASVMLNGKFTGFSIFDNEPVIQDVPLLEIPQGQNFTYQLNVAGGRGNLVFSDNSELISVNQAGVVYFSTSEASKGIHTAVVVVENQNKDYDFKLIQFEIK